MKAPISIQVRQLWPNLTDLVTVIPEISGASGVIDLLVAELDYEIVENRLGAGVQPICRADLIQVLWAVRDGLDHRLSAVARLGGWHPQRIESLTLPWLVERGLILRKGSQVRTTHRWRPVGKRLFAIEAKRRAWLQALRQAVAFSPGTHGTMVVLDEAHVRPALASIDLFHMSRVGLASLDKAGSLHVVSRPPVQRPIGWLHALLSERAMARQLAGSASEC